MEPVGEVRKVDIARKELEPWLVARAKDHGLDLAIPGARALVETLGPEPGQLVAALGQLQDVFAGQRVGPREIAQQFRGLGEQKTWDLCDRAFGKDLPGAIRSLRAIEEGGDEPLMVLGGIAARLRDLLKVRSLPDRMPPAQVAKEAGLRFDWQARRYQQQARNFSMAQLVTLHDRDHGGRSRAQVRRDRRHGDADPRRPRSPASADQREPTTITNHRPSNSTRPPPSSLESCDAVK